MRELKVENGKMREEVKELRAALERNIGILAPMAEQIGTQLARVLMSDQMLQLVMENATLKGTIAALKGELLHVSQVMGKVSEQLVAVKSELDGIKASMFCDDEVDGSLCERPATTHQQPSKECEGNNHSKTAEVNHQECEETGGIDQLMKKKFAQTTALFSDHHVQGWRMREANKEKREKRRRRLAVTMGGKPFN